MGHTEQEDILSSAPRHMPTRWYSPELSECSTPRPPLTGRPTSVEGWTGGSLDFEHLGMELLDVSVGFRFGSCVCIVGVAGDPIILIFASATIALSTVLVFSRVLRDCSLVFVGRSGGRRAIGCLFTLFCLYNR